MRRRRDSWCSAAAVPARSKPQDLASVAEDSRLELLREPDRRPDVSSSYTPGGRERFALAQIRAGQNSEWQCSSLRSAQGEGRARAIKGMIDDHVASVMCCQIPPYHDSRSERPKSQEDDGAIVRIWASFVAGIVLLSLSLVSAIWLASRLA